MDLTRQLKLLVLIILIGYFISKILVAKTKLDERKIGTLLRKINSDTVQGSLCYCFHVIIMLPSARKRLSFTCVHKYWGIYMYVVFCNNKDTILYSTQQSLPVSMVTMIKLVTVNTRKISL